jgi:putative oxidoreductase
MSGSPYIRAIMTTVTHSTTTPARKYHIRTALFMSGYVAVNLAAILGAFDDMKSPATWVFSLVVAAPVVGQIWALLAWMRDSDEFVRALAAKRFIAAAGLAMAVASAWGFMELYARAPHISAAMIYPLFWAAFGCVSAFIHTTR